MCLRKLIDPPEDLGNVGYKVFQVIRGELTPAFQWGYMTFREDSWNEDFRMDVINLYAANMDDPLYCYQCGFHIFLHREGAEICAQSAKDSRYLAGDSIIIHKVEFDDVIHVGEGSKTVKYNGPQTTVVVARKFRVIKEEVEE
jgi:hypothetical protein